jgi:hypothetical protein
MKIRWSFIFCISFPNQVDHTWIKSQNHIYNHEWAKILFVDKGLNSKLQHLDRSNHIEGDIMQNHL